MPPHIFDVENVTVDQVHAMHAGLRKLQGDGAAQSATTDYPDPDAPNLLRNMTCGTRIQIARIGARNVAALHRKASHRKPVQNMGFADVAFGNCGDQLLPMPARIGKAVFNLDKRCPDDHLTIVIEPEQDNQAPLYLDG